MFTNKKHKKKHVLWICGEPDTGKSSIIKLMRIIFGCDEVDWRGSYLPVKKSTNPTLKRQIVTCEEFNFHNALN